jgi:para-nitrobenzyl esterase
MLRKVKSPLGEIQGFPGGDPRITVFKGIPYAKPPIGNLRWKTTQPVEKWDGVYVANQFKPISWQEKFELDHSDFYTKELHPTAYEYEMSEDCLYLNIWSPAVTEKDNLPVFFYIHGGGYQSGYSYEMEFDGEKIARQGVIMVTCGYRLGVLGFFAHKDLTAEDPNGSQGNFGVMDQTTAIKWVYDNIAAFGGDPKRITICGQSAGAGSVQAQLTTPMTKGMLHGAIMMSGGGLNGVGSPFKPYHTLEHMQDIGERFLKVLGVDSIEEARKLPAQVVSEAGRNVRMEEGVGPALWSPTIDNVYLLEDSYDAMIEKHTPDIPYMFGYCADEGYIFTSRMGVPFQTVEEFETHIRTQYGNHADRYLELANIKSPKDIADLYNSRDFSAFAMFEHSYAQLIAEQGRRGYLYRFDHDVPGEDNPGSFHGSELWFVFNSLNRCWRPFTGMHFDLARQVSAYWVNFIKTGNPNGTDSIGEKLTEWRLYTTSDPFMLEFNDKPVHSNMMESELFQLRKLRWMKRLEEK